ncbi:MAG TPA: HD domain-containing phosphohydrolase [Gaiellaceae bacterium]|nr:HD domain-containing phosphohydrolase [Gaiellaceae bacterium]
MPARDASQNQGGADRRERHGPGLASMTLVLTAIWALGLFTLGTIVHFERAVDASLRAQVVVAQMRNAEGLLLAAAFESATTTALPDQELTTARLGAAKRVFTTHLVTLSGLGQTDAPARIGAVSASYFVFVDRLSRLVTHDASRQAALELGESQQPNGIRARLTAEFERADSAYGAAAARSRMVGLVATGAAVVLLLLAFSLVFQHSVRGRWRAQRAAMTDVLTGLGNRRKLFADMEDEIAALTGEQTVSIGIFDLDGFKAYNDTFGHPAGDALLNRIGERLAAAVGERGEAYRIGGDEFVVLTRAPDGRALLTAARDALCEHGDAFAIGCSFGVARIHPGITLEEALHTADQHLYTNKRSTQSGRRSEVTDALLQVLAEQDANLVFHLGHVAELAADTATACGLSHDDVRLTRLAAELHDIGKAAIPSSILDKPGALTPHERAYMQRHSTIGARIVAAAPTLEAIAPIVRAVHERPDGTGYPDGLHLDAIPIASRIIAVVDAYDAMTSGRPYQRPVPTTLALAELRRHAGTQFDQTVVEAFATALTAKERPRQLHERHEEPGERLVALV